MNETLRYYDRNAEYFVQETWGIDFAETQEKFIRLLPKGGKILDFGCGSGRDAFYFANKGFAVDAVDGSKEMCRLAGKHDGIRVRQMLFSELDASGAYDGIWACASILHLPSTKLKPVMLKMRQALKNGGWVYLSFKYGKFEGLRNGRYFTDFEEKSFEAYVSDIRGMNLKEAWIIGDVRPGRGDEKWLNLILQRSDIHIHLSGIQADGQVRDGLERAVLKLAELSGLSANVSKIEIKNAIRKYHQELKVFKEQLTNMVPYRALAGFFKRSDEEADWRSIKRLTAYIEGVNRDVVLLPYTVGTESKLKKKVYFHSSKSNRLPKWEPFFKRFAGNQYLMYRLIHEKPGIRKLYEACYRDNLHSLWAGQELYREGNTQEVFCHILQKNMQPVYDSARRQGYEIWNRGG